LTTIGYLIQIAPDKAFATLMKLTALLRRVLKSSGEFSVLRDEIELIESYLEIERARFEERLEVEIDVPQELKKLRVPTLIFQPLG
jgi:two-component system LytT family sensor kinase